MAATVADLQAAQAQTKQSLANLATRVAALEANQAPDLTAEVQAEQALAAQADSIAPTPAPAA